MKRMKSRLVRVRVWYDHGPEVTSERATAAIEEILVAQCARCPDRDGVAIHRVDVGDTPAPAASKRPEPDFD